MSRRSRHCYKKVCPVASSTDADAYSIDTPNPPERSVSVRASTPPSLRGDPPRRTGIGRGQTLFHFTKVKSFKRDDLGGEAVFLETGNIFLELWQFEKILPDLNSEKLNVVGLRHIAFSVESLMETYENFRAQNIEITEPKKGASGGLYSFLKDPDGISIELYQDWNINCQS